MPPSKLPMRCAHPEGHTDLCFDDTGRYILTCGSDGDLRVWDGVEDEDSALHRVGDRVYAVAFKNGRFFTASDMNNVLAHTFPDGMPDGVITRFTSHATHMSFNKDGSTVVVGSSDFTIKIVEVDSSSHTVLTGHEAPVLSVALDPQEEFVASSSCDGTIKIWNMSDQTLVKSLNLIPKCNDFSLSKTLCRLCWDPKEGNLISVLSFSPCGKYLAAGGAEGAIGIFRWKTRKCVESLKNAKNLGITALAWNPKGNNQMSYCDNHGQLGSIKHVVPSDGSKDIGGSAPNQTGGVFEDSDDDFLIQATNDNVGDAVDDNDDIPSLKHLDDDSRDSLDKPTSEVDDMASLPARMPVYAEGPKLTPLQRPFQPGSTPVHLSNRYMMWNSVGIIRQYNTEEENSIDIEFHDTATHHAMHLTNSCGYIMADLSAEAVVLASETELDTPSKLTCMHFGSWDNSKEWSLSMPDGEEIQAVTISGDWLAVATDARIVRVFSLGGIQREILTISGPVVCLASQGNQLLIAYHKGQGIPGDQCLGVTQVYINSKRRGTLNEASLPLYPKSTLTWMGFSAEGTPFYMDSMGIVRMLNRSLGSTWIQVANTKSHAKGKSDHYWIVGVNENPQQLRCIPCKGSRFPATLPRPALGILPFQLPLCEMSSEKSQFEESLQRTRLFTGHMDHWEAQGYEVDEGAKTESLKPAQEALMKLFALSTRSDHEFRALEVCALMSDQHTLQLAIKYASRLKHIQLAQRISDYARQKAEKEEVDRLLGTQEEGDFRTELNASHNTSETEWSQRNGYNRHGNRQTVEDEDMDEDGQIEEADEEESRPSGPMLNLTPKEITPKLQGPSLIRSNPFRVATPQKTASTGKGTQIFDGMSKSQSQRSTIVSPVSQEKASQRKTSMQMKLFPGKKNKNSKNDSSNSSKESEKKSSPFDLWLDENRGDLEEEFPDLSPEEFHKTAAERFQELPKEEKQQWLQKAKAANSAQKTNADNKKRKRDENGTIDDKVDPKLKFTKKSDSKDNKPMKTKPLTQTTNAKLSNFMFSKQ